MKKELNEGRPAPVSGPGIATIATVIRLAVAGLLGVSPLIGADTVSKVETSPLLRTEIRTTSVRTVVAAGPTTASGSRSEECGPAIRLRNRTQQWGLVRKNENFGLVFSDLDRDGDDDLVINNHGSRRPSLLLNSDGTFIDVSARLGMRGRLDRHGISVVDLDNDGDRDMVIASGGGGVDTVRTGSANEVLRNLLVEGGGLSFLDESAGSGVQLTEWRGRHFLPLPNQKGKLVDLIFLARSRESRPILYLRNKGAGKLAFARREMPGIGPEYISEGTDIPIDFNRDGLIDILMMSEERIVLLENIGGGYLERSTVLSSIARVTALGAGDLNGDAYPDLVVATRAPLNASDVVLGNRAEIHYVTRAHPGDLGDRFSFTSPAETVAIDFRHGGAASKNAGLPILVGSRKRETGSRNTEIAADQAEGEPVVDRPGIYVWKEVVGKRWHVQLKYRSEGEEEIGIIKAKSISGLVNSELEEFARQYTDDRVFLNRGGSDFEESMVDGLTHADWARSVFIADLNNDGRSDVVILRGGDRGFANGAHALLTNCGSEGFFREFIPGRNERLFSASHLVGGFVDRDGLFDLFYANGRGLTPNNQGPHQLLINTTEPTGGYVALELVGTASNRDAIGAQIDLYGEGGLPLGYRLLAYRGRAQDSHVVHFGLGSYTGAVRADILWPSGRRQRTGQLKANQTTRITEK